MRFVFFLLIAGAVLLPVGGAGAAPTSHVPVGHWAYEAAARLVARGLIPSHLLAAKPLTREEFARLVVTVETAGLNADLTEGDRWALEQLAAEFSDEVGALRGEVAPARAAVGVGVRGGSSSNATLTTHPAASPDWSAFATLSYPLGSVAFDAAGGWTDPSLQQASLSTKAGTIDLHVGRDALWWGPGTRGALLLSNNAGSVDMLKFAFEIPRIRYTKFAATLNEPGKYLAGTRIDWQINDQLRIGAADTVVIFAGPLLWYAFARPVPLLVMWEGNYLASLDFDWAVRPGVLAYGELMIDDVHYPFPPPAVPPGGPFPPFEPSRWGFMAGLHLADPFKTGRTDLRIEYTRVYNWTYANRQPSVNYQYRGASLGHWLGPDGDDLALTVTHMLTPATVLKGWVAMTRHGEGRLGVDWTDTDEAWREYFLAGTIETRYSIGGRWERRAQASTFGFSAELSYVYNRNNTPDDSGWDCFLGLTFQQTW